MMDVRGGSVCDINPAMSLMLDYYHQQDWHDKVIYATRCAVYGIFQGRLWYLRGFLFIYGKV